MTIVIDSVKAAQSLTQLHFWRLTANMKIKFGMAPRSGWTIRAFNAMYGVNAKTWQDIFKVTDDTIKAIREDYIEATLAAKGEQDTKTCQFCSKSVEPGHSHFGREYR